MRQPIKRGRLMAEINITPFTDVVLVLLIIFMITTPMLVQPGIKVKMPAAASAETDENKAITIFIDPQGRVYIEKQQVPLDDLREKLAPRVSNRPDAPIMIKGDRDVKYDMVIRVIDQARQAGARKFALGVELEQQPK